MTHYSYEQKLLKKMDFQQRRPLSEILYIGFKEAILDGTLPLGERINENSVAEQLSISRTPIRKAITLLVDEGLLEYLPNYGTVVKNINEHNIREIFKIRTALELLLYQEAYEKKTDADIQYLKNCCLQMIDSYNKKEDHALKEAFNAFNFRIYDISRLNQLVHLIENISSYLNNFRDQSFAITLRKKQAIKEHFFITNCLNDSDLQSLETSVKKHLMNSEIAVETKYYHLPSNNSLTYFEEYILPLCLKTTCPIRSKVSFYNKFSAR